MTVRKFYRGVPREYYIHRYNERKICVFAKSENFKGDEQIWYYDVHLDRRAFHTMDEKYLRMGLWKTSQQ
jgi:hypothetical protein